MYTLKYTKLIPLFVFQVYENKATAYTQLLKWAQSCTCPCPCLTFGLTSDPVVRRLQPYDIILQQMLWKCNTVLLCLLAGVRFLENGFELFNSKVQSQYSLQLPYHNFLVATIEQLNKWILVTFHIPSLKSIKRTFFIFLPHHFHINHFGMKCYSKDTI